MKVAKPVCSKELVKAVKVDTWKEHFFVIAFHQTKGMHGQMLPLTMTIGVVNGSLIQNTQLDDQI